MSFVSLLFFKCCSAVLGIQATGHNLLNVMLLVFKKKKKNRQVVMLVLTFCHSF